MGADVTREQERAVYVVAEAYGWDKKSTHDLGLMLWCLFRYYAWRRGAALASIFTQPIDRDE